MKASFFLERISQMRMVWSEEHDANTVSSVGLHCKSSTEPVCLQAKASDRPTMHTVGTLRH